jgi:hypothetical protein
MASFEEILNKPASALKPPPPFPAGLYHCLVEGTPVRGKSSQKGTDLLQFKFKILKAMDGVDQQAVLEQEVIGKTVTHDYYVTDAAAYRLTDMLIKHLGIEPLNAQGQEKSLTEMLAEASGQQVLVRLKVDMAQDGSRGYHKVDSTAHV